MRVVAVFLALAALVAACGGPAPLGSPMGSGPEAGVVRCEDVPRIVAPDDWYRDSPVYVANEMPSEQVARWASRQPDFQELWIDRERAGWLTVAFTRNVEQRQADLEREFPGVGVVAVEWRWTKAELEAVQRRAFDQLQGIVSAAGIDATRGVVVLAIGVMTPERVAAVGSRLAGEPVCVEGTHPADEPAPGPQRLAGDGWRLLADQKHAGEPYRTGIAADDASYRRLWQRIALAGPPPAVDFTHEVVIWFGAVFGSSCPTIRLDDVVVDPRRALVHAQIVLVGSPGACTSDANAHAYLVALERSRLPAGGFAIQLDADGPPPGVPEERTVVEADLTVPGAVPGAGQVHGDPALPEPRILEPGAVVEPDVAQSYRHLTHCGIEWLGPLNNVYWRTPLPAGAHDVVPEAWQPVTVDDHVVLSIVVRLEPEPHLIATANGHDVRYEPVRTKPDPCR